MSQHWDPPYPLLCQQWHNLGQNSAKNVSALGFSISIIVSTVTQTGKNSVNNVSALGFSISIIVSTVALIGTKLCQQCVSIGILHIHYHVNNDTNWGKIVSTMCQDWDFSISIIVSTITRIGIKLCQQCDSVGVLHIHYCVNNDSNCVNNVSVLGQ